MGEDKELEAYEVQMFLDEAVFQNHMITPASARLKTLLSQVYKRLPEEVQEDVRARICFAFQDPVLNAINIPIQGFVTGKTGAMVPYRKDLIVVFSKSFALSDSSLMGLLAHEIAHSLIELSDNDQNEAAADAKVKEWGFVAELLSLQSEAT